MTPAHPAALAAQVAWMAATPAAFRLLGPSRGVLLGLLGGYVLVPNVGQSIATPLGPLTADKPSAVALGLLLGFALFARASIRSLRLSWVDAPILAFLAYPLFALAANGLADPAVAARQAWDGVAFWGVPYLAGRAVLGGRQGPRQLAVGIALGGLATVPICLYEMVVGPRRYVLGLLYGIAPVEHMVRRLGGWRPEGFQGNGIDLATWMALASTVAAWAWRARLWRFAESVPPRLASAVPPAATALLAATTLLCRSVYGDALLALGLAATLATTELRTRAVVLALAVVPPTYCVARVSGAWDGRELVEAAGRLGQVSTVSYRLRAESAYVAKTADHGLSFGFGPRNSAIFDFGSNAHLWADGRWVHVVRAGGVVGLSLFFLAFLAHPVAVAAYADPTRPWLPTRWPQLSGLALYAVLHAIDGLHNMAHIQATALICGSISGLYLAGPSEWSPSRARRLPTPAELRATALRALPLLVTVAALAAIEVIGNLPRDPTPPDDDPATAPAAAGSLSP